jgi:inhibitor of cysteine peptidase
MIRTIPFIALSLFALFFSACQGGSSSGGSGDGQILGMSSNGETYTLRVGEKISVALPQNASTGYTWQLDDSYKSVLEMPAGPTNQKYQIGTNTDAPVNTNYAVGAPSLMTWTFVARKAGETQLKYAYSRSWEKDEAPVQTFSVTIQVTE